ncbi:ATP-binding cassette domain-containing protein [Candidatus Woesearchaeota archaeon]|nr:ATP-binding cassette domain-containing protein [Candidatus Woesearchaeota archaeon]
MSETMIDVRNVKKEFKIGEVTTQVLKGISFKVEKGEFVAITGASGSGKTTLFNQIGLIDTPDSGKVLINGTDTSTLSELKRTEFRLNKIGRVFQFFNLLPELTVLENIRLPMMIARTDEKKTAKKALELARTIKLEHRIYNKPSQISGGQMQLVSIARALSNDPLIILADEPTGTLDSKSSQQVVDLFKKINKETGKTIIMITHEKEFAAQADRTIHLTDGRIVGKEEFTLEFIESKIRGLIKNMNKALSLLATPKGIEEDTAHLEIIRRAANEVKFMDIKDDDFVAETKKLMRVSLKKYHEFVEKDLKKEELLEDKIDTICDQIAELSSELSRDRHIMNRKEFMEKTKEEFAKLKSLVKTLKEVDTKRELLVKRVREKLIKALPKKA